MGDARRLLSSAVVFMFMFMLEGDRWMEIL
jgi:hypothetical protein